MISLISLLLGKDQHKTLEERAQREAEITYLRHELKGSVQTVRSGAKVLNSLSGVVELNRRSTH